MAILDTQREAIHIARKRGHQFTLTPKWKTVPMEATVPTLNRKNGKKGTTTKVVGSAATLVCRACGAQITAYSRVMAEKHVHGYFGAGVKTDCTTEARARYGAAIAKEKRMKALLAQKERLWKKMREWEGIPDRDGMIGYSDDNPHAPAYHAIIEQLQAERRT